MSKFRKIYIGIIFNLVLTNIFIHNANAFGLGFENNQLSKMVKEEHVITGVTHLRYFDMKCKSYGKLNVIGKYSVDNIVNLFGKAKIINSKYSKKALKDINKRGKGPSCRIMVKTLGKLGMIDSHLIKDKAERHLKSLGIRG